MFPMCIPALKAVALVMSPNSAVKRKKLTSGAVLLSRAKRGAGASIAVLCNGAITHTFSSFAREHSGVQSEVPREVPQSVLPGEPPDHLHMVALRKHIEHMNDVEPVAALEQNFHIAAERGEIAAHVHHLTG